MKKTAIVSVLITLLIACGGGNELDAKKKKLADYKVEAEKLNAKIEELEKEIASLDTSSSNQLKTKLVAIDTVQASPFAHFVEIQGFIDSDENVFVSPETPGVITNIYVKEGDRVSKGTVLASSDASALSSSLEEVKTGLALATTSYEKQKRLWDQKIGSEIQFLQAKSNMEAMESRKKSIEAQINMSRIKSPISGIVDEVGVKLGEMGNPGMSGVRVVNLDKMKVVAKVADAYIDRVKKGNLVMVELPDLGRTMEAKVTFVSQVINQQNRSLTVEIDLPNKDKILKPNMIAKVMINDEVVDTAITVPSNIIQKSMGEGHYVLVAEKLKDGSYVARKREVTLSSNYKGRTVIESGIGNGDLIITTGYQEIVDGQPLMLEGKENAAKK